MIFLGLKFLRWPLITPASMSGMALSDSNGVWTPRSFRSIRLGRTASGMPPMPHCRTEPSSISDETCAPIARWRSVILFSLISHSGRETFYDRVQFADVNEAVAVGPWHLCVYLCHHAMRAFGRGKRGIDANAETAITVGIGRRHLNEGNVDRHLAALEQRFDLAQEDRRVVGAAIANGFADIPADKQSVMTKAP